MADFTVNDLFNITLGLMNEDQITSDTYIEYVLPTVNTLLSELYDDENALRFRDGQDELDDAPLLRDMTDVIPYHRELVRNVMPFGLGLYLYLGDDALEKATFFSTKYDENRRKFSPAVYVSTREVFSDGV